jgi:hypothetical protein
MLGMLKHTHGKSWVCLAYPGFSEYPNFKIYLFDMGNSGKQFPLEMKDPVGTYKYVDFQFSTI